MQNYICFVTPTSRPMAPLPFFRQNDETTFVMARGRVAPLKPLTVPQLELLRALTATRLCDYLHTSLIQHSFKTHFWTDSQIVRYWIQSHKKLKSFVEHHISEIKRITQKHEGTWHYCPIGDNPADIITKVSSTSQLVASSLWNKGPPWLTNDADWPPPQPSIYTQQPSHVRNLCLQLQNLCHRLQQSPFTTSSTPPTTAAWGNC